MRNKELIGCPSAYYVPLCLHLLWQTIYNRGVAYVREEAYIDGVIM